MNWGLAKIENGIYVLNSIENEKIENKELIELKQ